MRILLVNAFHYLRGGVERTYFDESRWLQAAGHDVAHLAIRDSRNLPSPTQEHFAPSVDYGAQAPALRQAPHLATAIWSRAAARSMAALLRDFRPDIAHVHAPSRYLTPSVLRPLEAAGVPIVMTLHDFKPWCTNRTLFAHGAPCERCSGGRHWRALATGCVQGSRLKSAAGALEAYVHDALGAYRAVRLWIAPSRFALEKARTLGAPADRLRLVRHGVESEMADGAGASAATTSGLAPPAETPFVLYAGRLSEEKGVRLLPGIARAIAPTPLVVAGEGPLGKLLEGARGTASNLRLMGRLEGTLGALRARAAAVVVPSIFYETYCYAAAEALLDERPVVAARIGAIPELVEHEATGLLVEPGDEAGFAQTLSRALGDNAARDWGVLGRRRVVAESSPAAHVRALLGIYLEAIRL